MEQVERSSCPKCGSTNIQGFRQYDTQRFGLRSMGAGEQCDDCGAWWKLGEWTEYPDERNRKVQP